MRGQRRYIIILALAAVIAATGTITAIRAVWPGDVMEVKLPHPMRSQVAVRAESGRSSVQAGVGGEAAGSPDDIVAGLMPTIRRAEAELQPVEVVNRKPPELPHYIMAMAADAGGKVWIGTEEEGVWRYDPASKEIEQFTTKDGLGDDNGYAVAVDKLGRVWVGHLNHGVSVYVEGSGGGGRWQNYEVVAGLSGAGTLAGPIGERVFDIAVCPRSGDVWMATSAGLARYSRSKDEGGRMKDEKEEGRWRYYTRAEGMSSGQVQALAFDEQGRLYAGTQCDGIDMADPADDYRKWGNVRGEAKLPVTPAGEGLPTDLINDLLVARDGTVYAATTTGLAWSRDRGATWQYLRGQDWAQKVRGLYGGPPAGWSEQGALIEAHLAEDDSLLAEDYVTCLSR